MRHRPGFSLAEVLVALTLAALAATLSADLLLRAALRIRQADRRVAHVDDARHLVALALDTPCDRPIPIPPTRHPLRVTQQDAATHRLLHITFEGPSPPQPLTLERACD